MTRTPRPALSPELTNIVEQASIVVVDDTPSNVTLLEQVLHSVGAKHVRGFTDPRDALGACRASRPDLALVDLHMPHHDAPSFIAELHAILPADAFVPVIVLTADMTRDARQRVLAAGAKDFLTKPFDVTEVVLRVGNLLETVALHRRLEEHNHALRTRIEAHAALERDASAALRRRHQRLDDVLATGALAMVYQPIVAIDDSTVVGAEALARFATEPPRPPNEWFDEAAALGRDIELELAAIDMAIAGLDRLPAHAFLSVNASPTTVRSAGLHDLLSRTDAERVVIEITEHQRIDDYEPVQNALQQLRTIGVRVAVDDTGAGYASLTHILRLQADILKLDIGLTRGIDHDPVRRSLAAALVAFAHDTGAHIVAEGVETAAELDELRTLGVTWAQGYHLARPSPLAIPTR